MFQLDDCKVSDFGRNGVVNEDVLQIKNVSYTARCGVVK